LVTFRTSDARPILSRGPAPGLRFFLYATLSITLMWLDHRHQYLDQVRHLASLMTHPVQVAVGSPAALWSWLQDSFSTRATLHQENAALREQLRATRLRLLRLEALEQENLRLREMRAATAGVAEQIMVAEIMRVDLDPFRQRAIINKGTRDGVFKSQPLLDATGVFGQVTRAGAFSSEVILISDTEHAIPVQINRNGLRTIAVGTGDPSRLSLPFLPTNADIEIGDLLVTSGLGGVFPPGYPVGAITRINTAAVQTMAEISAKPAATLDRNREVLLIWVRHASAQEPAFGPEAAAAPPEEPRSEPAAAAPGEGLP
jgi:rod shape-determining protein MreC